MKKGSIPQWEVFEHTFMSDTVHRNPFTDVTLNVVFKNGERSFRIDGFYDGNDGKTGTWRVRFAPMKPGTWTYRTSSNDEALSGLIGSFECTEPISRGGLAINPQFPNWFWRASGDPQFIVNDGWIPHTGFNNQSEYVKEPYGYPAEPDYLAYLDTLGKHRVNMAFEVNQLYARQTAVTDPSFKWPWLATDPGSNKFDRDRFSLEFYRRLDRTIAFAKERGIFYGVELLCDNSVFRPLEWSHHPWNRKNGGWLDDRDGDGTGFQEAFDLENKEHMKYVGRFVAYTLARTAAYWNVWYAVGAESGNIDRPRADTFARWYGHWGDFIALHDPHGRLLSFGDTGECAPIALHSRNHILMTQEHTSMDDPAVFCHAINRFGKRFWQYDRPVVIGEQDRFNNNKYPMERRGYWIALTSGFMMSRVDRHFPVAENGRFFESVLFKLPGDPPIYDDLERMAMFVDTTSLAFWRMAPHDELLEESTGRIYCLAEPGQEYLIYFAFGGSCSIELPAGFWTTLWFNPSTGEYRTVTDRLGSGRHDIKTPDGDDWVYRIVRME